MIVGMAYWWKENSGERIFVPAKIGHKWATGLIIEADGLHTAKVPVGERMDTVLFHHVTAKLDAYIPYPAARLRSRLRKMRPATDLARTLTKVIMEKAHA